jgi:internalin A
MSEKALRLIEENKLTKSPDLNLIFEQLESNALKKLEEHIWLKELNLNNTEIKDIHFLQNLTQLQSLHLRSNQIQDYSFLQTLTQLQCLNLRENQIQDHSFLQNLTKLQSLDLRNNQIRDISFLQNLTQLQSLDLSSNQIQDYSFLQNLTKLQSLDLRNNQIRDISFLQNLTQLQSLDLSSNQIKDIKPLLALLKKGLDINLEGTAILLLKNKIGLKDNPFTNLPIEILKLGREAVIKYFENIDKNVHKATEIREIKVILLGEGDSGKTTLIKRLIGQQVTPGEKQTQGIKQVCWTIPNAEGAIQANVWDFGGQEIQHSTHQFFLTEECIYILVLDNRRDEQPEYWLQHILSLGTNSRVLVVSNKVDKPEHAADRFNQELLKEKYPFIQGFYKISALLGTNIDQLKDDLVKLISAHQYPKFGVDWMNVKDFIEAEITLGKNYITSSKLHEHCKKLIDKQDEKIILNYMKNIGKVSFYQNNLHTRNFYILNPEWLIYALYKIILSARTIQQTGEIHLDDFGEILQQKEDDQTFELLKVYEYEAAHYGYLLEMMKEYGLCYTADNQKIIIPSAFSEAYTTTFQKTAQSLSFYFQYLEFLPPSIISQFIANIFEYRHKQAYWRSGIELYDKETKTSLLVQVDKEQKRIYIAANGEQKRKFFDIIRRKFKEINAKFPEMRVEERIPLPSKETDQSIDYDGLINHELEKITVYFHPKTRERFAVSDLLASIELETTTQQEINKRRIMGKDRTHIEVNPTITVNPIITNTQAESPVAQSESKKEEDEKDKKIKNYEKQILDGKVRKWRQAALTVFILSVIITVILIVIYNTESESLMTKTEWKTFKDGDVFKWAGLTLAFIWTSFIGKIVYDRYIDISKEKAFRDSHK